MISTELKVLPLYTPTTWAWHASAAPYHSDNREGCPAITECDISGRMTKPRMCVLTTSGFSNCAAAVLAFRNRLRKSLILRFFKVLVCQRVPRLRSTIARSREDARRKGTETRDSPPETMQGVWGDRERQYRAAGLSALARVQHLGELLSGVVEKRIEVNTAVLELLERPLLRCRVSLQAPPATR